MSHLVSGGMLQHWEQVADAVRNKQQGTAGAVIIHHRILLWLKHNSRYNK